MKFLIVGFGSIGSRHLNNLFDLGITELSVFQPRKKLPHQVIKSNNVKIFQDYENAIAWQPDAVVIANPTALHCEYAKLALAAGSHVYIEKPVSDMLAGTEELLDLAETHNKTVAIGCQLRFHPNLEKIKHWLDQKRIGKILSASVDMGEYLPDWHPWEDYRKSYAAKSSLGGGVILTQIHDIDYLYWLFGCFQSVYAIGGHMTSLEIDVEDTAIISLVSAAGFPVQMRMDYWRKPPVRTLHILGEDGDISWDYHQGKATLNNRSSMLEQSCLPPTWQRNDLFMAIIQDFLHAIKHNKVPRTPLQEGIDVLEIALAAKTSIMNKTIVKL